MAIELKIPNVGESVQEVQISRWLKREGDSVTADENVVELETDKASMELAAPASGVVKEILKKDGEKVAVGETIARFEERSPKAAAAPFPSTACKRKPSNRAADASDVKKCWIFFRGSRTCRRRTNRKALKVMARRRPLRNQARAANTCSSKSCR
jgi:pyruvate/2-oxoglutarate dehydrogenase complex dihydrolipoamide acyltransferase (E2) component